MLKVTSREQKTLTFLYLRAKKLLSYHVTDGFSRQILAIFFFADKSLFVFLIFIDSSAPLFLVQSHN